MKYNLLLPLKTASHRIILSRPDRLGDGIISTSAIRPILEQNPAAEVYFATRPALRPVLEGHPGLAGYINADLPVEALTEQLQQLAPSAIVHLHTHPNMYQAGRDAGIPVRVGYFQWKPKGALTHWIPDRRKQGGKHEAMFNFDLLGLLGTTAPKELMPEIHLPEAGLASLEKTLGHSIEALKPYAVLNPSAYVAAARWPVEYFVRLAEMIRAKTPWRVVVIGDNAEEAATRQLSEALGGNALNMAGKTNVAELGWLLKHSAGVVTRDTGPSHLAGAVGAPTVSICGRTRPIYSPIRWGALGPKVELVIKCPPQRLFESRHKHWARSFASITPEEVFDALIRVSRLP